MPDVQVAGHGIGLATAMHCLTQRGIGIQAGADAVPASARGPLVMLGDAAQALLTDVFAGQAQMAQMLAMAHPITRRIVRWGSDTAQCFAHSAVVVAADRLRDVLVGGQGVGSPMPAQFALTATPGPDARLLRFGQREAAAAPVMLQRHADRSAAYVEALGAGWLFLIPTGGDAGWLLAVGADPAEALRDSAVIADVVAEVGAVAGRFETAPRLADPCATAAHLTVGSAGLALDPICGDGTATAVRGGILAAAVAAAMVGADRPALDPDHDGAALVGHYRLMLIAAMRRHLGTAWPFYTRGGTGAWWQAEAAALAQGHAWCTQQLAAAGEARFVLAGDRLVARGCAA
ncbi:hypothetical protein [Novosphingobium sp.]|uniref:hypothetical protein n=1 Tax=Novosphingobium sp. TaxID=1874826 RepID=UPI003340E060